MNKKGLDAIVTTVILILLAIVAIGIVWVVVKNVIEKGASQIETGSLSLDLSIKGAYANVNVVNVNVRRSAGAGNLTGIKFIFSDGSNSYTVDRESSLLELDQKLFTFNDTEVGGIAKVETVSIAPIYQLSGSKKTGGITDTANIGTSSQLGGGGNGGNGGNGVNGGAGCGDGFCESGETSLSCPQDCTEAPLSCNGIWDGDNESAGLACDGTPLPSGCSSSCMCKTGFSADGIGGCNLNPSVNNGVIFSTWPSESVKYFDSDDLPTDVSGYTLYYVNFTNSTENGCFRITWAEYLELNGRSYLRTEFVVNVSIGQQYDIWAAQNCGLS